MDDHRVGGCYVCIFCVASRHRMARHYSGCRLGAATYPAGSAGSSWNCRRPSCSCSSISAGSRPGRSYRWYFLPYGRPTTCTGPSYTRFEFEPRTDGLPCRSSDRGFCFNMLNAYVNARFISSIGEYGVGWLGDPRFLAGLAIFFSRDGAECPRRQHPAQVAATGRRRLHDPAWRCVPLHLLPELSRGNHRVGRLGAGHLVAWRVCVFSFIPLPIWLPELAVTISGTGRDSRIIRRPARR